MPRRRGHAPGGLVYQVLNRSVGRMKMFRRDGDFEVSLRVLSETKQRGAILILGYKASKPVCLADKGDVGRKEEWFKAELDDSKWEAVRVPGTYDFLGVYWYRVRFKVPSNMKMGKDGMTLHVGAVDDESWVWLNGRLLGEVTKATNPKDYYSVPREYQIKEDMLRRGGENVLVVRVNNTYQTGGILGAPRLLTPAPWLGSYYLQTPLAGDDPYRYYRW